MKMTHSLYQNSITVNLTKWQRRQSRALKEEWLEAALLLYRIDLDYIREELKQLYSPNPRGRPPFDATAMLRALLLMSILRYQSIDKFADELRRQPRLAIIAGFTPFATPAVGTFYLFVDRLEDGPYIQACNHRVKLSSLRKGSHRRNLKKEKEAKEEKRKQVLAQCDSITENLKVQLLSTAQQPRPADYLKRLEDIFIKTAVILSANRGLMGELDKLIIAGDGSALVTGASSEGKRTCSCRSAGIYSCEHDRLYRDGKANWGYDNYRDCFYFGYSYYQYCVSSNGHDLPIHISIEPASESDHTQSMKSLDRMIKAYREHDLSINIYAVAYDSGHDGKGNYLYLMAKGINPVISLNHRKGEQVKPTGSAQQVNEDGIPICIGGVKMRRLGITKHKTIAYGCPVKRPTHQDGKYVMKVYEQECPLQVLCQPDTKMGPVVTVSPKDDPRHYPVIERGSERYNEIMNLRTGCERSNAVKKVVHHLDQRPCRSGTHYLFRLYLISMVEHGKAWLAEDRKLLGKDWRDLIDTEKLAAIKNVA